MINTEAGDFKKSLGSLHRIELPLPKCRVEESKLSYLQKILTTRAKDVFSLIYLKFGFRAYLE